MLHRHHRGSIVYALLGLLLVGFLLLRPAVDLVPTQEPGYTLHGSLATSDDGRLPPVLDHFYRADAHILFFDQTQTAPHFVE